MRRPTALIADDEPLLRDALITQLAQAWAELQVVAQARNGREAIQLFDERRTGLDHMSFAVAARADLDAWASWLDSLGVENSGVTDTDDPVPYSVVVFRDPDNIQLELFYMAG